MQRPQLQLGMDPAGRPAGDFPLVMLSGLLIPSLVKQRWNKIRKDRLIDRGSVK